MTALVLAVALSSAGWNALSEAQRAQAHLALPKGEVNARMLAASERFLGARYQLSPLGEGRGRDSDPLMRFDAFDCLTLVEQVMALAIAPTWEDVPQTLLRIRYDGDAVWEKRKHIMEAQWLPLNVRAGFLEDITAEVAGGTAVEERKVLGDAAWASAQGKKLALPAGAEPRGAFLLEESRPEQAALRLRRAPSGSIVVVVRADRPNSVTRVTHVGLLVQTPQGPVLRHASKSYRRVADEPLAHFLKRNLEFAQWTVSGLSVFRAKVPGAGL